jgi:hypothetical protein
MRKVVLYEDAEKGIRKTKIDFILPEYIVKMCKGMKQFLVNNYISEKGL